MAKNCRDLKPLVANYLKQQYHLKKEEIAYYIWTSAMNYEYWKKYAKGKITKLKHGKLIED